MGGENSEEYWRGRAQEILGQIVAVDQAIASMKDDIKKYGSGGFDVTTGMKDNIAYINDRNGQLKNLEKRKADLEKQLDELQDEGRKAGAPASWFREREMREPIAPSAAKHTTSLPRTYQTFVQEKRPIPKLPLGPVVFGTASAVS